MGGEGSRDLDRTASGLDLWPARPQDKRKGRAGSWQGKREEEGGGGGRLGKGARVSFSFKRVFF